MYRRIRIERVGALARMVAVHVSAVARLRIIGEHVRVSDPQQVQLWRPAVIPAVAPAVAPTEAGGAGGSCVALHPSAARLHGMGLWMDVMRDMEHLYEGDYEATFRAWCRGGVVGLVIGPLLLDAPDLVRLPDGGTAAVERTRNPSCAFDPDPAVYERFGVSVPEPESEVPYFAGIGSRLKTPATPRKEQRQRLHQMLVAAKRHGLRVMIFQAQWGAPDDNEGTTYNGGVNYDDNHHLFDLTRRRASIARIVDALQQFPEADGFIWDGPEWGYEIDAKLQGNGRSYIFHDLPEELRTDCHRLGYDYDRLHAGMQLLYQVLHDIDDSNASATIACVLGDSCVEEWLCFRKDALTHFFRSVSRSVKEALAVSQPGRTVVMGVGTRSYAFASLCGYDLPALAAGNPSEAVDILMPKHYFYHRGFDGLVGTVARYCNVLCEWNGSRLSIAGALSVVKALFDIELPGLRSTLDFESVLDDPEFYSMVVERESKKVLLAVGGDAGRVVPWVDAGRLPHDGDPMTAGQLRRIVEASYRAGLRCVNYHHHSNLSEGEWTVLSALCGQQYMPSETDACTTGGSYHPPDRLVI